MKLFLTIVICFSCLLGAIALSKTGNNFLAGLLYISSIIVVVLNDERIK
jgi:hypothetical protein